MPFASSIRDNSLTMLPEVKFIGYALCLYVVFVYWGYLQEKVTSTKYKGKNGEIMEWNYTFSLNIMMSFGGFVVATVVESLTRDAKSKAVPFQTFWKCALSSTCASPLGYHALNFISFPLVVLVKSCKPVPVILVGMVLYGRKYTWYKLLSVALLCAGIAMFSSAKGGSIKSPSAAGNGSSDAFNLGVGILLVSLNLLLDGYTNNEQDEIFKERQASSIELMKNVNLWSVFYIFAYLALDWVTYQKTSEISRSSHMFSNSTEVQFDILMFCLCAAVGQVLVFKVMKEFGSLAWITISITRKLFTILFSVFMFGHPIKQVQWLGIACVFLGMIVEVGMGYIVKAKTVQSAEDKKKK